MSPTKYLILFIRCAKIPVMRNNIRHSSLVVGHLVAEPATRMEGHLKVGTMPDGTAVRLPVVLINGRYPGKTLYIQAISDGDELNGIAVVHKILRTIAPEQLHGKIIAVPVVNFHAFHAKQALSPVDSRKMNRCFPGRPDGTSSERIAYHLFQHAVQQADYCLDLHQGRCPSNDRRGCVSAVGEKHTLHNACLELARVFGIGHILDQKGPKGATCTSSTRDRHPNNRPRIGWWNAWLGCGKYRKRLCAVVRNVLRYYDFIAGNARDS